MDKKKLGDLIATLRKKKGLTQQELGDKVGVGFRAVSKWERGITTPDITIINELSKILGISSDELLAGELKEQTPTIEKKKSNKNIKKILIILIPIIIIVATILIILNISNNKTYTYNIASLDEKYMVEGKITLRKEQLVIMVNKLTSSNVSDKEYNVNNYEHKIKINDKLIIGYGIGRGIDYIDEGITIKEMLDNYRINYEGVEEISLKEMNGGTLTIEFIFYNSTGTVYERNIKCRLEKVK